MKQLQLYDFNLAAGESMNLPVQGAYVRVISCTGNINIIADTFGKLGPISRGQGLEKSTYNRLTIQDASGAPNVGTILVSESNFIDQTLYGSIALAGAVALDSATLAALEQINVRPEAPTGFYAANGALAANTADPVFLAAANTNGAILLSAYVNETDAAAASAAFVAKATAPATVIDGEVIFGTAHSNVVLGSNQLALAQYIPAGKGLYFICTVATTVAAQNNRSCRYKLL